MSRFQVVADNSATLRGEAIVRARQDRAFLVQAIVAEAGDRRNQQQPLVLAVDDAHLLDEHSAIVLHRVVIRRLAPAVVTRTGEPARTR